MFTFFCKHEWKLLSETTTESKFERSINILKNAASTIKIPWQMCDTSCKYIQVFECKKCGKIKRFEKTI